MRRPLAGLAFSAAAFGLAASLGMGAPAPAPTASSAFWKVWGDGNAELSGYAVTTRRYGAPRKGTIALIYVTEPMDRRVWIKDDAGDVPPAERVNVLKLNNVLKFQAGIYPYSVMTSVFSPVDSGAGERFAPAKIVMGAQEWCGQVYQKVMPGALGFAEELRSYFHADGERNTTVTAPAGTLYEDALLVQLRELDGPFADGGNWSGTIVPSLWAQRKKHAAPSPVAATILRESASRDGVPVSRFTLAYEGASVTYDVEKAAAHRVLGWKSKDGEDARLLKTARLPYWQLNSPGDERFLEQLGL